MVASSVLLSIGYTALARGDRERATEFLEEGLAIGRQLGDKAVVAAGLLGLGIAATLRGEPNRAKALLKESLTIDVELGGKWDIAEDLEGLAEAAGALGEDVRAARPWGAAAALREAVGHAWAPAERMLHEPQLAAARSRLDEAAWEKASAEGRAMGLEEAVEYALSEEEPTSATPRATEQPSESGPRPALSRRESEVAALVARGLSNREIAQELHLSERTVHAHVRTILKKLSVPSRGQVAARLNQ